MSRPRGRRPGPRKVRRNITLTERTAAIIENEMLDRAHLRRKYGQLSDLIEALLLRYIEEEGLMTSPATLHTEDSAHV